MPDLIVRCHVCGSARYSILANLIFATPLFCGTGAAHCLHCGHPFDRMEAA